MEIERKYLINDIKDIPYDLSSLESHKVEQAYISVHPTIRIRKLDEKNILTVKSGSGMAHEEAEISISEEEYSNLAEMVKGCYISKIRYIIPIEGGLKIELDIFKGMLTGLIYAEIEFVSVSSAESFIPPKWFGREVTGSFSFTNAGLSRISAVPEGTDIVSFIENS